MGKYSRQRGARPYLTRYTTADLENAVKRVKDGGTIGKAAIAFNVPKSTLYRKVHGFQPKKHGGQSLHWYGMVCGLRSPRHGMLQ